MSKYVGKTWEALPSGGDSDNKYKSSKDLDLGASEVIFWKSWNYS